MLLRCAWGWDITEERRPLLNVFLKRGGAPTRPNRSQLAAGTRPLIFLGWPLGQLGKKNENKKKRPVNQTKYKKGRRRTRVK
jgi:hypothetical protein